MADGSDSATTRPALVDGRPGPTAPPRDRKEDDDQQEERSTPKSPAETRSCSSSLVGRIAESLAEARGCAGRAASAAVERMRRVADSAFALPPNVDAADTKAVHAYTEYLHEEFSSRNEDAKEKTPFFCPPLADSSSLMRSEQHTEATSSSPKPLPDVIPRDDNKSIVPDLQVDLNENPRKPSFMQKEPEDPDSLSCESEFADSNEDVAEDSTLLRDLVLLNDDSEDTTSDSMPQDRMDLGSALNKLEKDEV